jgi:FKBP-type peptidyl-prolyl cis-trans isomerase
MKYKVITIVSCFIGFVSCNQPVVQPNKNMPDLKKEHLIELNRSMVKQNELLIKAYVKRNGYTMTQTETGLWYEIYKKGKGAKIEAGTPVELKYTLRLLDGTLCYSSDSLGLKKVKAGLGNVETGLDEALLLMNIGDAAHIILQPHLAYGFSSDGNRIPPTSTIVYDIEVFAGLK